MALAMKLCHGSVAGGRFIQSFACRPALLAVIVTLLRSATGLDEYSKLPSGELCEDYLIPPVTSKDQCFNTALAYLGMSGTPTLEINEVQFTGCVYNKGAGIVMYGVSSGDNARVSSWEYICNGKPTTTTTTTTTASTSTATTPGDTQIYSLIDTFETCSDYKIEDVNSTTECFDRAVPQLNLGSFTTFALNGLGFTGCVLNSLAQTVFYSETPGGEGVTAGHYRYICRGFASTTTTTTTATTITITTSTSTQTTSTRTTSTQTTSTQTQTTNTSTQTTETFTASVTRTTVTATTSTTTTLTITETYTTTTSTITTVTTTTTTFPPGGFVGEDPISFHNGILQQFWLPEGRPVSLLRTPEFHLLGVAMPKGNEQYITRIIIQSPSGEPVLQVSIRDDIANFSRAVMQGSGFFETVRVSLDYLGLPLTKMPSLSEYAYRWQTVVFAFSVVPRLKVGRAQAEMIVVDGMSARVVVMSAVPQSLEGTAEAAQFAHLDFVLQLHGHDTCEGILPELWGLRPYSEGTASMLESPY